MAQHNAAQSPSDTETDKGYMHVFKRRQPLMFSPKRRYALAVISPLQKQDSCETDERSSGAFSSAHANNRTEIPYELLSPIYEIPWRVAHFQPFSFDARDAARKVEHERRLQEMRQLQEQQWHSTFKAHPIRRYKPLVQLRGQSQNNSQQLK
uniref:Siaz-interacting nuclear protein n=1 Tax=Sinocyclocheilus anshuiensis TaxID=1608454 RepID=A0A671SM92_9TELE